MAILAKELVNNRNTQKRLLISASKIDSVGHRMTTAAATMKMTQAMGVAAKVFFWLSKILEFSFITYHMLSKYLFSERDGLL